MPREIVHWNVLEYGIEQLSAHRLAAVKRCLINHRAAAYLGAMAHDAPYYLHFGGSDFESVAEMLHGSNGEDTFKPLTRFAKLAARERDARIRELLWATFLGLVSHYATDIVFHPAVYYFTGNYYEPDRSKRQQARARHREFEVFLDSWCRLQQPQTGHILISDVVCDLSGDFPLICGALTSLGSADPGPKATVAQWQSSFIYMKRLQSLFLSPFAGRLAWCLNRLCLGRLSSYEALFSFKRNEPLTFFDQPLVYRNPISGELMTKDLREMRNEAVEEFLKIAELVEPLIDSCAPEDVPRQLDVVVGRSLNFGLPRAPHTQTRHFGIIPATAFYQRR